MYIYYIERYVSCIDQLHNAIKGHAGFWKLRREKLLDNLIIFFLPYEHFVLSIDYTGLHKSQIKAHCTKWRQNIKRQHLLCNKLGDISRIFSPNGVRKIQLFVYLTCIFIFPIEKSRHT